MADDEIAQKDRKKFRNLIHGNAGLDYHSVGLVVLGHERSIHHLFYESF